MGLAEVLGKACGTTDAQGTWMHSVVDKIAVVMPNGVVIDSIDMETVHRNAAGTR